MSFQILQVVSIFLAGILLSSPENRNITEGYRSVIRYGDGFIATGSGGHIDWISPEGRKTRSEIFPGENFNCLLEYDHRVVAAGENGSILVSSGKKIFMKMESGTVRNINSLAVFRGLIIAGADNGEIITGDGSGSFKKNQLGLKGNIVSVSARESECFGVTDKGEIIHTWDGSKWEITDFNKVYAGYYKPCYFTAILVTDNRIAITGIRNDGSPVMMFSTRGGVWTERILNYTDDQGIIGYLSDSPNDISYYEQGDEYYLACSNGKLLKLPSCSQCNKLIVLSDKNLEGISIIENNLMIVGENYLIRDLNLGL